MIVRIWHGWTVHENADRYETLLRQEVFPSIENKKAKGYRKISLLKRIHPENTEFITIMQFDDLEAVRKFAGEDYSRSYVPDKAREILLKFDERAQHYEVIHEIEY